ncbi:MAG TPA: imidazolonepropionase [Gemmatimonadales bacterium]|jgi:imidazolonepropionase|nr:imidazolonepropionase [Gemmatimonadales bacterium]
MPVLRNIGLLARCLPAGPQSDLHAIPRAALVWEEALLRWVGPEAELPSAYRDWATEDAGGRLVVPGLVDCHTHLAFAGWRADEFAQRIAGKSYLEIAAAGGGIAATVAKTRAASEVELLSRCRAHLDAMARLGITTVEAKSGYGLSTEQELRLLGIYRELGAGPQRIVPTLLAAHVVPAEYRTRRDAYVELIVAEIIPAVARDGLALFCDVFVEESAFTVEEARRILAAGQRHRLRAKLHADQLSNGGGAELAAELGAVSADHLEQVSEEGIRRLAAGGVVAVSLPFAALYLGSSPLPARKLLAAGVSVAVATDFNPGTAPSYHLPMALTLACTLQRMTPVEALKGATIVAARAVGLEREVGSLEPGKSADFALVEADSVEQWLYHLRANACVRTVCRGRDIWRG